ncbi:MAG: WYL domain-containing protein [Clostridia bacterium]|nr:WYL domain-containing protein [Clostridia bacterium]
MTFFSELYGAYYNAVAKILAAAVQSPVTKEDIRRIVRENAFAESGIEIESAIFARWQLLDERGGTPLRHVPTTPLTHLQKRWLKAVSLDPRLALFDAPFPELKGVEPLFQPEDICVFDRFTDGDPYGDETYIRIFRIMMSAVRERTPLYVEMLAPRTGARKMILLPLKLEYSEKDDKFRLLAADGRGEVTLNLARVTLCRPYDGAPVHFANPADFAGNREERNFVLELTEERNTLERVMLHFAHFRKEARRAENGRYLVRVFYERPDETELVIRVLSFGPTVTIREPDRFAGLVRERLLKQYKF